MLQSMKGTYYYKMALIRLITNTKKSNKSRDYYKKIVFYGVKAVNALTIDKKGTYEENNELFRFICFIKNTISELTPNEFTNIFPIQKIYDGERFESKDYHFTMNYLKTLKGNEPIGDDIDDLLWDYVNTDTRIFNTACFIVVDVLRKSEGKQSMMTEWANINGLKTYSLIKDNEGKEFMFDKSSGETFKVKKKRPRYLKLLK